MAEIVVVGGGIGGLTFARCASRAGHRVTVLERRRSLEAVGAGLVRPGAAVRALARAGVRLGDAAQPIAGMRLNGPAGRGFAGRGDGVAIARPALAALLDPRELGVEVLLGASPEGPPVAAGSGGGARRTEVALADGRVLEADLVVGADGLRSAVRSWVAPGRRVIDAEQLSWRAILPREAVPAGAGGAYGSSAATETWDGQTRVGVVPLTEGRAYVFVVASAPMGSESELPERAPSHETKWALDAVRALPAGEVLQHRLEELDRPAFGVEGVALLGDAAHAMTPNLGMGAAMAIGDAEALVRALERGVYGAVGRSARRRWLGRLAHSPSALPRGARRALGLQARRPR
ncbi:FAD-dependent monooxygenase [Galactobacter valiniphilus]|uniref:FAD-dependent monooxygenase n=1 Tax=Galactobacter valiniphilus TaxID=2676122 RepID=UPI003736593D